MKKVFIKYNPYKLETEITVDGKNLKENSEILRKTQKHENSNDAPRLQEKPKDSSNAPRLQEWIEELPQLLIDEYNDDRFEIEFHGTLLDYEDLTSVFAEAGKADNHKNISFEIKNRIPAKETTDKEKLIDTVFENIKKGPFDELRDPQIINAFENAKSTDFEVCVVATMSAGKSTLINAMLGQKLMPSRMEACTAIITRIKDISTEDRPFKAEVFYKNNPHKPMESHSDLTLSKMEKFNADDNVSVIKVSGNIPFVSSDDVSLVLIDTPGGDYAIEPNHGIVQSEFLEQSSKALVLYIMTGEFGTNDDNGLIKRVADSMAHEGKKSKDRFIFVINKLDERKKEDGDINQTLDRARGYLLKHGIANPNLFPAAALPALNIRMMMRGADIDEDTIDETEVKVKKLNRPKNGLFFEEYAVIPASLKNEINGQLEEARASYNGPENENKKEALIHTGVVSIEAAIRQYVQKYAKTAKIKNIVDTFMHKIEEEVETEGTKKTLAAMAKANTSEANEELRRVKIQIAAIREKIDSTEEAQKFKSAIDAAVVRINDGFTVAVEEIIKKFQSSITKRMFEAHSKKFTLSDVQDEVDSLVKFAKKEVEPNFKVDLNAVVENKLIKTFESLCDEYRKNLESLTGETDAQNLASVKIDPLKLMGGSFDYGNFSYEKFVKEEEVEDGEEWVKNTDKKWYKPWTWFQESGYFRTKYKEVKYIPGDELTQAFFQPVDRILYDSGDVAKEYAMQQSKKVAERFNLEFKRLNDVLKAKLAELQSHLGDKDKAEERLKEAERRLKWLENIKTEVESILEI